MSLNSVDTTKLPCYTLPPTQSTLLELKIWCGKGRTIIFLEGRYKKYWKNCLQGLKRQNKLFANVIREKKCLQRSQVRY